MHRRDLRIIAGILARLWVALIVVNGSHLLAGDPPAHPPSFWDGSVVLGVGRPGWVYYHVTNLPRNSVLYCPDYPGLPEAYPDWPKRRLERPIVEERDGQVFLRDPQVERVKEQEKAERAKSEEGLWTKLWRTINVQWKNFYLTNRPDRSKNYLFVPKIDETFTSSTLFRYLPPDQFWQVCSEDVILVGQGETEEVRERLISQGRDAHKIVILVGATPYSKTIHTVDFWQPWSVFCQKSGSTENEKLVDREWDIQTMRNDIVKSVVEPGEAGEQTTRKWRILRQTDIATGSYVELLVDPEGETKAPWSVPATGSRFELWVMRWGTVQPSLVSCWSSFKPMPDLTQQKQEGRTDSQLISRFSSTGGESLVAGQPYRLAWSTGAEREGDFALQRWSEDVAGAVLDVPEFTRVDPSGDGLRVASNRCGSESYALWWRENSEANWVLLSHFRQPIQPLPRVDLDWSDVDHVPRSQPLELSGHYFPTGSGARVMVKQSGRQVLIREFTGKSDWDFSFSPEDIGIKAGRVLLSVEYPAPWTSKSEQPERWKTLKAFEVALNVVEGN